MSTNWNYRAKPGERLTVRIGDDITVRLTWEHGEAKLKIDQKPRYCVALFREKGLDEIVADDSN